MSSYFLQAEADQHFRTLEERRQQHVDNIYERLEPVSRLVLPDATISGIVDHLPSWRYDTQWIQAREMRLLEREQPGVKLDLPESDWRRSIELGRQSLLIIVPGVTGADLRLAIDIDRQTDEKLKLQQAAQAAAASDPIFRPKELEILARTTHASSADVMAKQLEISPHTTTSRIKRLRERLGGISYPELMIAAVALRKASLEHVAEGRTRWLTGQDMGDIAKYFHPAWGTEGARRGRESVTQSDWVRLYRHMNVYGYAGRYFIALYCLRDDVIQLPDADKLSNLAKAT